VNPEELRRSEELLFSEWKATKEIVHKNSIADGVVHAETYINTTPRLLFLAREAHWEDEGDHDIRGYLAKGAPGVTFRNWQVIARWTRAITTAEDVPWEDVDDEARGQDFKKEEFRKIAFVNIKKQGGSSSVNWNELVTYTKVCAQLVRRQIELYNPNIIVCNGTIWLLERFILPHTMRDSRRWSDNDVVWFPLKDRPCIVIEMPHFAARKAHKEMYERLVTAYEEIRQSLGPIFSSWKD